MQHTTLGHLLLLRKPGKGPLVMGLLLMRPYAFQSLGRLSHFEDNLGPLRLKPVHPNDTDSAIKQAID